MKILLLDGESREGQTPTFRGRREALARALERRGHEVRVLVLREKTIRPCVGCFRCWIATPGTCVHSDDGPELLRAILETDVLVLVSPLAMGFFTATLKGAMDRCIPLALPYLERRGGELHHPPRYGERPVPALLAYEPEADTEEEDHRILAAYMERLSRNRNAPDGGAWSLERGEEAIADAVDALQRIP
ncbi:multimeric flavodoxin WrbA [Aminomonas paucivorans DSM 12260]|uniref:Multimeric flavodoxin WrbA n=1 Tax=Aminomonas paucivorans DSM 12260 TaxID=584708 RepID=E3CUD5_9BACT|nr:flavodoxin family protein [Aminomonas paucivorans]EFQ23094.1 multimeric flavodoxin WrbA [Aminomonas paucivorans DSM 12260]